MIVFITGLPGSGKSAVGERVSKELGWDFYKIDDALSEVMNNHIAEGVLLTAKELDELLLERVVAELNAYETQGKDVIVAGISGYRHHKEQLLEKFSGLRFVTLIVPYEVLKERFSSREHFAGSDMLQQCWEGKDDVYAFGVGVDAEQDIDAVVRDCVALVRCFELKEKY